MRDYSHDIEMAIPDNLRLGEHADAKLVNGLLARIIVCMEENDSVWRKNRMKCLHDTIARWNEEEFAPHIAKEDEDWNSLKSQIAANEAELASLRPKPMSEADRIRALYEAAITPELFMVAEEAHFDAREAKSISRAEDKALTRPHNVARNRFPEGAFDSPADDTPPTPRDHLSLAERTKEERDAT